MFRISDAWIIRITLALCVVSAFAQQPYDFWSGADTALSRQEWLRYFN